MKKALLFLALGAGAFLVWLIAGIVAEYYEIKWSRVEILRRWA